MLGIGLGSRCLKRRPSGCDSVIVGVGVLVVGRAGGSDLEAVAQLVGIGAKSDAVAADRHRSWYAIQVDEWSICHAVAGV